MPEVKRLICKDCKFFKSTWLGDSTARCLNPKNLSLDSYVEETVYGCIPLSSRPYCTVCRKDSTLCGLDGKKWEPKSTKESKIREALRCLDREA